MSKISDRLSLPPQELYLLAFLAGVSAAMYLVSLQYNSTASLFPQLTAGFVIFGIGLVLVNQYLPESIRTIVMGDSSAFERDEFSTDDVEFEEFEEDELADENGEWHWTDENVFTAILFSGYIVLGYLIGLLWATPIFVYAYARWFDQPRRVVWSLVVVSLGLAVVFWLFLNLPMEAGLVHELVGLT